GPSKLIRNRTQLASPEAAIPDTGPGAPAPDTSQLPSWNPSTSHSVAGGPPSATGSTVESLGVDDGAPLPVADPCGSQPAFTASSTPATPNTAAARRRYPMIAPRQ